MTQNQGKGESLKDLWIGIALTIVIYAIGGILLMTMIGIFGLILSLVAHIIVLVVSFSNGKKRLGQGLLIGLGLVMLLVAACFGIVIYSLSGV